MKVFLSWSGEMSHQLAKALHDWLPYVIQAVKPFISSGDIEKGKRWSNVLSEELQDTAYGIVCITPYNLNSSWLHFEAGAISKAVDQSYISPLLLRIDHAEIQGPLSQFQTTSCNKSDIYKLVYSINSRLKPERQLTIEVLRRTFDRWWPELENTLNKITNVGGDESETGFKWLNPKSHLLRIQASISFKSAWIITQRIYTHAIENEAASIVRSNLERGVEYAFIIPCLDEEERGIHEEMNKYTEKYKTLFKIKQIDRDELRKLAVSDYIIFNPIHHTKQYPRRMFLELPVNPRDYWIEVDNEAAINFIARFNDLISI